MLAMTLTVPPHSLQVSMWILNAYINLVAQVIARYGMYAGFRGAKIGH